MNVIPAPPTLNISCGRSKMKPFKGYGVMWFLDIGWISHSLACSLWEAEFCLLEISRDVPGTCECYLVRQYGLCRCDYMKALEMGRLFLVNFTGLKWNHTCP